MTVDGADFQAGCRPRHKMRCSSEIYLWEWYENSDWYSNGIIHKNDIERFTMIDIQTHHKIQEPQFADLPNSAEIGDFLLVMYPAFF